MDRRGAPSLPLAQIPLGKRQGLGRDDHGIVGRTRGLFYGATITPIRTYAAAFDSRTVGVVGDLHFALAQPAHFGRVEFGHPAARVETVRAAHDVQ
jgi:hypothetical protein